MKHALTLLLATLLLALATAGDALTAGVNRVGFRETESAMRLSWNEIRSRAAAFAKEWHGKGYERGETQTFYNEFFEVFGLTRKRVATYEEAVKRGSTGNTGFIDLYWKGTLLVEQKSAGLNLVAAKQQAFDYLPGIKNDEDLPRYILLCDFQTFELHDLETRNHWNFGLQELPEKVQVFSFMFGGVQREFKDEDPVNIKASELMGELHDALKASGYDGHDLERFLVRLVFCLFADDTGIFTPRGILMEYIENRTAQDGTDLGPKLGKLFETLNRADDKRQKALDEDLAQFPYVNGELFAEQLSMPDFDGPMRKLLLEACAFDWSKISPAIFGSLFQSVMDKKKRRAIGAHYTNEQNILKVIGPLFLDDLKEELKRLKARKDTSRSKAMLAFQDKLAAITCLDPACGCGNFLVIAYRELRALETDVILDQRNNLDLFADKLSKVDVNQFYGIEFEEFPVRIAETALWMMDHIMNQRLSDELGEVKLRIPLKAKPTIRHADALEVNWAEVLPPEKCSYVFGNPPFGGKKEQNKQQKAQMRTIFRDHKGAGTIDFVAAWFKLAKSYLLQNPLLSVGFVATKSICQGEQTAALWPQILDGQCEIIFAHRTFEWSSEAKGKAHVHVIIVGLGAPSEKSKRLFDYENVKGFPTESIVPKINAYLASGPTIFVRRQSRGITDRPKIRKGSEATDFGHLIISKDELQDLRGQKHFNEKWIRPYVGGKEYINSIERYCLWLLDADPKELQNCAAVYDRIRLVESKRLASGKSRTISWAKFPSLFTENRQPKKDYLLAPKVSSQTRDYVPFGFLSSESIVSGSAQFIETGSPWLFALLSSRMHMSWMRAVGGRTKSDYQYTNTLVYNTFPFPILDDNKHAWLAKHANEILVTRKKHSVLTLAKLYSPKFMKPDLRKAHEANDKAVDQLYRKEAFASDRERVEFLLARYEQITAPALALAAQKPKGKRGKSR